MDTRLQFEILAQPDDSTCGPTCLLAVYRFFDDRIELDRVIREVRTLPAGGTLAVWLACHALRRGYRARIYTYNLMMFDPTWFEPGVNDLPRRLRAQAEFKRDPKLHEATEAYLEFLEGGGELRFADLTAGMVRRILKRGIPILTGLSATYLYHCAREFGPNLDYDDVRGDAIGHFVVLCGYDKENREVLVADPNRDNPMTDRRLYAIDIDRVTGAILLGVLTSDANLLIIEPGKEIKGSAHVDPHRG
jgi:hypothetical protein